MTEDKTLREDEFREDERSLWAVPRRHRGEAIPDWPDIYPKSGKRRNWCRIPDPRGGREVR